MNRKSTADRAKIVQLLVEGNSLRSTSRIAGCSINTVLKLLAYVGEACLDYQDQNMFDLPCRRVEVDELCSFVGCRRKNEGKTQAPHPGEVWVWMSICPETKLMINFAVGDRSFNTGRVFMDDLAPRFKNRIQITSDGLTAYKDAVDNAFGMDVDFGMLVKQYSNDGKPNSRYKGAIRHKQIGDPDPKYICTSYIERSNLTLRMACRRFTRRTNAFSKKLQNHALALGLHFVHYNFVRVHSSLRVTPAMEAGIEGRVWSLEDLVEMADGYWRMMKSLGNKPQGTVL